MGNKHLLGSRGANHQSVTVIIESPPREIFPRLPTILAAQQTSLHA
mgnify:CR=1 FL=1